MNIDIEILAKVMRFVADPRDEQIDDAALQLLRMNRNQVLYRNIIARPQYMKQTLIYELNKCIAFRQSHLTDEQRQELNERLGIIPEPEPDPEPEDDGEDDDETLLHDVGAALNEDCADQDHEHFRGQRDDHEQLPEKVREWYEGSKERWFKMKEIHSSLQQMDDSTAEERAEYTRELRKLYKQYRQCLMDYDHYEPKEEAPVNIAQKVATARKYLSENREKLAAAIEAKDEVKVAKLRTKMQERIRIILDEKLGFDPQIQETLTQLGLIFD